MSINFYERTTEAAKNWGMSVDPISVAAASLTLQKTAKQGKQALSIATQQRLSPPSITDIYRGFCTNLNPTRVLYPDQNAYLSCHTAQCVYSFVLTTKKG